MKKSSGKILLVLSGSIIVCAALCFCFFSNYGAKLFLQKSESLSSSANTTASSSYQTDGKEEEVPHFNLFSIINKFIPH